MLERFVIPFYGTMLHGNCLTLPPHEQEPWLDRLRTAAGAITPDDVSRLLDYEWRSRLAAAWFVALNEWSDFVPRLAAMLIESELCFSGQGYCLALARIASEDCAVALVAYLDEFLPRTDLRYDQYWAMAALRSVDRSLGTDHSAALLGSGGLWERWADDRDPSSAAPIVPLLDLLRPT